MDVLFVVAALVFTLGMTEAATPLVVFIHEPRSNIHLKCLTNIDDEWDDLTWYRTSEKGVEYIGHSAFKKPGMYNIYGNNEQFKLHRTIDTFSLNITNVQPSDSGTYCCVRIKSTEANVILNVAVLVVKENNLSTSPTSSPHLSRSSEKPQQKDCEALVTVVLSLGRALLLCVAVIAVLAYITHMRRTGGGHRHLTKTV
ncbi:uncharacterized protein LOC121688669 isoform X2 [Alosa sapidissima]|uniref:uncharacterized protein LOC121688669 isoform X2 n=1 Tax=Alosa sapidissima TaxID=34773 RepID=UPI001C09A503|nr:uncharacterized protein LOC121688669 isoform X2 [Alosa sapidissima]